MSNSRPTSPLVGLLLAVLISTLSSCAEQASLPGAAFEGTITQIIKVPGIAKGLGSGDSAMGGGGALLGAASNVNMKIYAREDRVAYEMAMLGGLIKVKSIINRSNRTITTLMPGNTAHVVSLKTMDSVREIIDDSLRSNPKAIDTLAQTLPQPTGRTMEINGFEAEEYVGKMQGMDVQMWMTSDPRMKFYEIVRDAVLGRQRTGMGGVEEIFAMLMPLSSGKIPVKFEAKLDGEIFATSELTEIEEGKLDDSVFEIPKGYKIVNQSPSRPDSGRREADSLNILLDSIERDVTGAPKN